jgi:uncharacterized protein with von Willebrand factor type A (vWA) domain
MGMDFAKASERVRGLLAPKKVSDLSRSALTPDPLRDRIVHDAGKASARYQATKRSVPKLSYERDGEQQTHEWTTFGEAVEDYSRASFGYDEPQVLGRDKVRPSHRLNREVLHSALHSEGFRDSRPYTRGNEAEAIYGGMAYAASLEESARELLAEHVERSEQIGEAEQAQQSAEDMMESLRKRAREENQEHGTVQKGTRGEIKRTLKQIANANGQLVDLMQQQAGGTMTVDAIHAGEAAAAAADEAVQQLQALTGAGLDGGQSQNMTPDQQIALAEKWAANPTLQKVLKNVGRMIRSMHFARDARTKNVPVEPVGITIGADLEHVLPQELSRAVSPHPLLQATFMRDYANKSLLQYEMQGKAPAGKGPIIEIHDGSGSMMSPEEKFIWATSLGLAMLTIAQRDKRDFAGIEFGSRGQLESWLFPKGETPDPERVLHFAGHFFGGGTSTVAGLREALRILKERPEFKSADVVLIGDGIDSVGTEDVAIAKELRDMGVRIHGISILHRGNAYMEQICDYVNEVMDLAGPNDASDELAQNIT